MNTKEKEKESVALFKQKKKKTIFGLLIKWIFLSFFLLYAVIPLLWLLMVSFKTHGEFLLHPLKFPDIWHFENYPNAFIMAKMNILLLNSVIAAGFGTLLNILVSTMGAFVIVRQKIKFSGAISNIIMVGVLIPLLAFMIPYLKISINTGLYNTRAILILTYASIQLPISFFIISSFMKNIPKSLEEAAIIDGATDFQRFIKIIFPLTIPGIITAGTLCFIWSWNEFVYAMLLTSSTTVRTVQLGIRFFISQFREDIPGMFAAITIAMLPSIIVYVFLQRRIISGLTAGAVKG